MPFPAISAGAGAIGGALIGAAGSYFSGKSAADFAERSYKHRYQWQVKDLQKAGLNPMLAVSQGAPNVPQPNFPNLGEGAARGAAAGVSASIASAQIANLNSNSAKNAAETDLAAATAANVRGQTNLQPTTQALNEALTAQARQNVTVGVHSAAKIQQETSNLVLSGLYMGAQMALVGAQTETEKVRARLVLQEITESAARTGKAVSEMQLTDVSRDKLEKLLPGEVASQLYDLAYKGYGIPGAKKQSSFDLSGLGTADPYIKSIGGVADVIGKVFGLPASALILRGSGRITSPGGSVNPAGMGGYPYAQ